MTHETLQPIHRPDAPDVAGASFDASIRATPILRVEGLIKIYGKRRVVDGVSFHVNHGEIVGLLGPNGAGKTTSFRMTCGLIDTNGGIVYLDGKEVTNWPMYRRSREGGMGYLPQECSVFRNLTVRDNLLGVMELLGMNRRVRKNRCDELLEKFNLTHLHRNKASGLSGGERRRLEVARALVSNPKIILLDEPFANIDPITVQSIQQIIRQLAVDGISILITDHQVRETLQITQRSYVIRSGQVLCHGTPEEVINNEEARKVYFGNDVSIGGNSSVYVSSQSTVSPPDTQESKSNDRLTSMLRPRPRPKRQPVDEPETELQSPSSVTPRRVEPLPARPVARSVAPTETSSTSTPVRVKPMPRPTVRSVMTAEQSSSPESPNEATAPPPDRSSMLKVINTLLWGSK